VLDFLDFQQSGFIIFAVGAVLALIGFMLGGHNSNGTLSKVFSMLFKTVGFLLLISVSAYFITNTISGWVEYSESLR
jgi:hypothetical protein